MNRALASITCVLWLSGCPRTPVADVTNTDATSERADVVRAEGGVDGSNVDSGVPVDVEEWPCRMLPAEVPNEPRFRVDGGGCGSGCSMMSELEPSSIYEEGDLLEFTVGVSVLRARIGQRNLTSLGQFYEVGDSLLPPFSPSNHASVTYGVRADGGPYALAVAAYDRARSEYLSQLHEVDRTTGRSCVRYGERFMYGRGTLNGIREPARLSNGYAWMAYADNTSLADIRYLRDGESVPRDLTNCRCVVEFAGGDDVAWWRTENQETGATALWAFTERDGATRVRFAPALPNIVTRISIDPTNGHRLSLNLAQRGSLCPQRMDIALATLEELDAGQPPRRITDDDASQTISAVRGRWIVYTDYSADTLTPNGCPNDPHARIDIVRHDLDTGARRVLNTGTLPMSPIYLGRESAYVINRHGMGTVPYLP